MDDEYEFTFRNKLGRMFVIRIKGERVSCDTCTEKSYETKPCKYILAVGQDKEIQYLIEKQGVTIPKSFLNRIKKYLKK